MTNVCDANQAGNLDQLHCLMEDNYVSVFQIGTKNIVKTILKMTCEMPVVISRISTRICLAKHSIGSFKRVRKHRR